MNVNDTYKCSKCGIVKEISEFGVATDRKSGHRSQCKQCLRNKYDEDKDKVSQKRKERRNENGDDIREKRRKYYQENKEKHRKWDIGRKEKISDYKSKYREENKDKISDYNKEYQLNNLDKFRKSNKKHYKGNKKEILAKGNEWKKKKIDTDPLFKLKVRTRTLVYLAFKNKTFKKGTKTTKIIGCSFVEFKNHIENQFEEWMNWENYGKYNGEYHYGWDLDHIVPLSTAKTEEDVIMLNHYKNFQPLCSHINRNIKKDKIL